MDGTKKVGTMLTCGVLAGLALLLQQNKPRAQPARTLLAGIDLNALSGLEVFGPTNAVHLIKQNGRWLSSDRAGDPVDFNKLAQAVCEVAAVELGPPLPTGDQDEAAFGPDARRIVFKAGEQVVAELEVGKNRGQSGEFCPPGRFGLFGRL